MDRVEETSAATRARAWLFLPWFLGLAVIVVAYNRLLWWLYPDIEVGRRRFGQEVVPLYAELHPVPLTAEHLPHLLPPIGLFIGWMAIVGLALRRMMPAWLFVLAAVLFVFMINMSVAMMRGGAAALTDPFARPGLEYYYDVRKVESPGQFIRDYPELNRARRPWQRLTLHAGTHPPGGVLFLWAVAQVFEHRLMIASLAAVAFTTLAVIPAYLLARDLYGPAAGVMAAGMYLVTPNLVQFGAVSMDGVFAVFPILSVWLFFRALSGKTHLRMWAYAVLTGLALAAAMFMTWATFALGLIFTVYGLLVLASGGAFRRTLWVLLIAAGTFFLVHLIMYLGIGYNPYESLLSSIERDRRHMRPAYDAFIGYIDVGFGNLFAFLIGAGLASVALWFREITSSIREGLRRGQWDLYVLSFALSIVILSFASLFTLETERVWLFLTPFIITAAAKSIRNTRRAALLFHVVLVLLFVQTWLMERMLYTWW